MHRWWCTFMMTIIVVGKIFAQIDERNQNLLQLANQLRIQSEVDRTEALSLASKLGIPVRGQTSDGSIYELIKLDANKRPLYYTTYNATGADLINTSDLYAGGSAGLSLSGAGETLGIWDGGAVRNTHQEFGSRVTLRNAVGFNWHATHVAGTMAAGGFVPNARGMSPGASLLSYDWFSDTNEMATAAAVDDIKASQHSYGFITGWAWGDWANDGVNEWHWWGNPSISPTVDADFGYYSFTSRDWDNVAHTAKDYLIVVSAGNDRNDGVAPGTPHQVWNGGWVLSTDVRENDGGASGYDCISHSSVAKNVMTVGAVHSNMGMSSFSGWGPTDDGRVKPDIVAKGVSVYSSDSGNDSDYRNSNGTSMSGPMVSGSIGLLQEHWSDVFPSLPKPWASTMKGIIIHTASDLGPAGPDYQFGWGLMNTAAAASFISNAFPEQLVQESLSNGETYTHSFYYDGSAPLKFTLCWTDPPGTVFNPQTLNDRTPVLANDLDLRLENITTSIMYMPYTLDPENPSNLAVAGDNVVDNVEMIETSILPAGNYRVTVSHKNFLGAAQDFSIMSSGPIGPLSLEIISIEARESNGYGYLEWITEPSQRGDRLIVEKSRDGKYFFPLDTLSPTPSTSLFQYVDRDLRGSPIWYYRIQSLDILDEVSYSSIVTLMPTSVGNSVLVYPNPGSQFCHLSSNIGLSHIVVYDQLGRVIYNASGKDIYKDRDSHYTIATEQWQSGWYLLEMVDINGLHSYHKWLKK